MSHVEAAECERCHLRLVPALAIPTRDVNRQSRGRSLRRPTRRLSSSSVDGPAEWCFSTISTRGDRRESARVHSTRASSVRTRFISPLNPADSGESIQANPKYVGQQREVRLRCGTQRIASALKLRQLRDDGLVISDLELVLDSVDHGPQRAGRRDLGAVDLHPLVLPIAQSSAHSTDERRLADPEALPSEYSLFSLRYRPSATLTAARTSLSTPSYHYMCSGPVRRRANPGYTKTIDVAHR